MNDRYKDIKIVEKTYTDDEGENFQGYEISNMIFENGDIDIFKYTSIKKLDYVVFVNCQFNNGYMNNSILRSRIFKHCKFNNVMFNSVIFEYCNFEYCKFNNIIMKDIYTNSVDFRYTNFNMLIGDIMNLEWTEFLDSGYMNNVMLSEIHMEQVVYSDKIIFENCNIENINGMMPYRDVD